MNEYIFPILILFVSVYNVANIINEYLTRRSYENPEKIKSAYTAHLDDDSDWGKFLKKVSLAFWLMAALWVAAFLLGFITELPFGISGS
jgi:ABC-type uncharacterized transport system permease subunit